VPHPDPLDPPRRRANQARGHGTWEGDRPPVCGVVGRAGGQLRLSVERHADAGTLNRVVREASEPPARVHTDDWRGYDRLAQTGHPRSSVCHGAGEWARDDDGDGVREVHTSTQEGLWTGLRNFLRPFRGVNKVYLYQYVAIFEWGHNIKRVKPEFIRAMLGVPISTFIPP
jgi:transposase